jgi:hypothetical protein
MVMEPTTMLGALLGSYTNKVGGTYVEGVFEVRALDDSGFNGPASLPIPPCFHTHFAWQQAGRQAGKQAGRQAGRQ